MSPLAKSVFFFWLGFCFLMLALYSQSRKNIRGRRPSGPPLPKPLAPTLSVRERPGRPLCSLCRESVGKKGWRCDKCSSALHRACRKELKKKCPTLGCK